MAKGSATTSKKLAQMSCDCSFLLTHLVRQNGDPPKQDSEASAILQTILEGTCLMARGVGWYDTCRNTNCFNPETMEWEKPNPDKAVCFTESTLLGLQAHAVVFGAKYGLSFDRDFLYSKGANPCFNIGTNLLKLSIQKKDESYTWSVYNFIPIKLHPFVNIINDTFDATHEREWRHVNDLHFNLADVKIIFCPEGEFEEFSKFQKHGKPTLFDLAWLGRI